MSSFAASSFPNTSWIGSSISHFSNPSSDDIVVSTAPTTTRPRQTRIIITVCFENFGMQSLSVSCKLVILGVTLFKPCCCCVFRLLSCVTASWVLGLGSRFSVLGSRFSVFIVDNQVSPRFSFAGYAADLTLRLAHDHSHFRQGGMDER